MQDIVSPSYPRDLGNGLVLRWSTAEDTEKIAVLHGMVHRERADEPLNLYYMKLVRALMYGDHPFMGPGDFGLIEDTSREGSPAVACTCAWRHIWAYEGIPFRVGRPEMVATDPAYRNRGLIRDLLDMFQARSEAEGDLVQVITGIPYFYRQFGYEYAIELDCRRAVPLVLIPPAHEGGPEPFTLREATVGDIPEIAALYARRQRNNIVSSSVPNQQWLYDIETWRNHPDLVHTFYFQMIVDAVHEPVGFVASYTFRWGKELSILLLEFAEGVNIQVALPSVLRALHAYGLTVEPFKAGQPPFSEIGFYLGSVHPVYEILSQEAGINGQPPYAWYVHVSNLPGFLRHIAAALETRLAASPVAGYTGEIKLDFYRDGLRMLFERGRLMDAEPSIVQPYSLPAQGRFPQQLFLQVVFGYRSIETLLQIFPDVSVSPEIRPVLKALFPTRPSYVFGGN